MGRLIRPEYFLLPTPICDRLCQDARWRDRFPSPRQSLDGSVTIWSVMVDMTDEDIQSLAQAGATPCSLSDIQAYLRSNTAQWDRPMPGKPSVRTRAVVSETFVAPVELQVGLPVIQRWRVGNIASEPVVIIACHGWIARVLLWTHRASKTVSSVLSTRLW